MSRNINTKHYRLKMRRKPFIKFGTLPEGMKPLGNKCPSNCANRHYVDCPTCCRYDVRLMAKSDLRDTLLKISLMLDSQ